MRSDEIPDRVSHLIDKVSRDLHYVSTGVGTGEICRVRR